MLRFIEIILFFNSWSQNGTNLFRYRKNSETISDPKRLKIVDMLSCKEQCANKLQQAFAITQPTLSHDMKVLVESGLIIDRRDGKNIFYSLNPAAMEELCAIMGEICQKRMHCICEHGRHEEQGMMENPEAKNDVREIAE